MWPIVVDRTPRLDDATIRHRDSQERRDVTACSAVPTFDDRIGNVSNETQVSHWIEMDLKRTDVAVGSNEGGKTVESEPRVSTL